MQITKNFTAKELECPCCEGLVFDDKFVKRLQILRDLICVPMVITSGYRCRIHNEKIGGSTSSRHLYGSAVDVKCDQWDGQKKWEFVREAMQLGMSVGIYKTWFHIDLRLKPGLPVLFYGR